MGSVSRTPNLLRIADLAADSNVEIAIEPGPEERAQIAAELGINAIRKLRLIGKLSPLGKRDWHLSGALGATVVQNCVVTLEPVTTRIDETFVRSYLAEVPEWEDGEEVEMPEDDNVEPLPEHLDLQAVMIEALALNLPAYPRAEGAAPLEQTFTAPGVAPLTDDDIKPFAGLAALKEKLQDDPK